MKSKVCGWGRASRIAGLVGAGLLVACGGGEQVQTFQATRVLALGDETSVRYTSCHRSL